MGIRVLGSVVGGMWLALGVGACVGQDPVVGANVAEGDGGGAPSEGSEVPGYQGTIVDQSVNYVVSEIRAPDPGVDPTGFCLPQRLPLDPSGLTACHLLRTEADEFLSPVVPSSCDCAGPDQALPDPALRATGLAYLRSIGQCDFESGTPKCDDVCLCELLQTGDARRTACMSDEPLEENGEGWCYISPIEGLGPPETVAGCPNYGHRVRLFGGAQDHSLNIMTCGGVTAEAHGGAVQPAPLGSPCLPLQENRSNFEGFRLSDTTLDLGTAACGSGVCLVNHFEGRASCAYGQFGDDVARGAPTCFVPGTDLSVTTPVAPQRLARRPDDTVTCSCQCDGPGPGPYCDCPSSMICSPVIDSVGIPAADVHVGSYCINRGTEYDSTTLSTWESCGDSGSENCGERPPH